MLKSEVRYLSDLKKLLYDQKWLETAKNFKVYEVYREIKIKNKARYDETLIFSRPLGKEFPKTKGHEHPQKYEELIMVLKGEAIFLLQKDEGPIIKDNYFIRAKAGQFIISPKAYTHITINPEKNRLKIGTWVADKSPSSYKNIENLKGAGWYYTTSGWKKNKNYKKIPKLKQKMPLDKLPKNWEFIKK